MSIDVTGKNCKLWIPDHKREDGSVWHTYTVGVSKKDMDGHWVNAYQDILFTKNAGFSDDIPNGTVFDFEGWMSVKTYKDRDGKEVRRPVIMVNKANFEYDRGQARADSYEQLDGFEQASDDIPFN